MHNKQASTNASLNNYVMPMPAKYSLHYNAVIIKYSWASLHLYTDNLRCQHRTSYYVPRGSRRNKNGRV